MIFSKKCEYAIRVLVHLAQSSQRSPVREISQIENVPYDFAAKILQELRSKGFVRSARGSDGGFALGRPATAISLMEIVVAMECADFLRNCVYGLANCSDHNPCPLHEGWKPMREQLEVYLANHTIADLAAASSRTPERN